MPTESWRYHGCICPESRVIDWSVGGDYDVKGYSGFKTDHHFILWLVCYDHCSLDLAITFSNDVEKYWYEPSNLLGKSYSYSVSHLGRLLWTVKGFYVIK